MVEITPTTYPHIRAVAEDMRMFDQRELKLFLGKDPLAALSFIQENSNACFTVFHKGVPSVIVGYNITDLLFNVASPFMIATNYAEAHPLLFARHSPELMKQFKGFYLRNWVLAKNEFAIKWLEWLGFFVHPTSEFNDQMIRMFTKDCR